ncbi:VWA domain-containing protein [Sphingomonas sp. G-3-2-10]|uniref:vWA domain-containing protein n=1 Tax=Sphingomonas sp. G-3-2-10 TaxID=2728838 RepID=UPI00146AD940|nr:VWA domain-containing protein [Sphingomonas sp. G-3-2-10]NML05566.1 VWA domain-containing protein [Sphingomonas sp. G-3-2-10]
MRVRFLVSAGLAAVVLAGCNGAGGSYSSGPYQSEASPQFSEAEIAAMPPQLRERYKANDISPVRRTAEVPVSTFAVDVDTAAYSNVRRFLTQGQTPPRDAVRSEELINYFRYDYPLPGDRNAPFSVTTDVARTPWNPDTRLLRIGLRGYDLNYDQRPAANLVFLVDVSGSMDEPNKLPLVKQALAVLADNLRPQDCVSIVVYAGAAGIVLDASSDPNEVKDAIDQLSAGGSTAGGEGIELAYATARANMRQGGINRVILATDGDFNVGMTDQKQLEDLIEKNRDTGITLTTLGFGEGNLNDAMMEGIADKGNGNYAYIDSAMEARKVLDEELSSTLFTIAKDVKVQVEFNPDQVSEYRLIGYENRALKEEDFANDRVDAGDIGAGHQVTAIYEIVPKGTRGWLGERRYAANRQESAFAGGSGEFAFVKLRYKLPNGETSRLIERPVAASLLSQAGYPTGDMAFAVSVAGFAQMLRGDPLLNSWNWNDLRSLAGNPQGYYRQEFLKLVDMAESGSLRAAPEGARRD